MQPGIEALARLDRPVVGVPEQWRTVGHLYRGIEAGLAALRRRYGEDAVFIGPPAAQAVTATFEWKELTAVTDLTSASQAIDIIVEQGEGARGDWVRSHFGTFVGILEDFLAMQAADPGFYRRGRWSLPTSGCSPDLASGTLIEDPLTARVADLCNGLYEVILQVLKPGLRPPRRDARRAGDAGPDGEALDELGDASTLPGSHHSAGSARRAPAAPPVRALKSPGRPTSCYPTVSPPGRSSANASVF